MKSPYSSVRAADSQKEDRTMARTTRSVALLAAASLGMSGGYTSIFAGTAGVFLLPIAASLGSGRGVASTCMALASLGLAVSSPFVGRMMDRYGSFRVIACSAILFVLALSVMSMGPLNAEALALKVFMLGLVGVATSPVGYSPILAQSFERRLGLAFGIASLGAGVGAAIAPMCAGFAIRIYGWQSAYVMLAVAAAVLSTVALGLLHRSGLAITARRANPIASTGPGSDSVQRAVLSVGTPDVFSTPQFWIISVSIALVAAVGLGGMVHIPALLIDKGASAQTAAAGGAFAAVGLTIGRFAAGMLLDYIQARILAAALFTLGAMGAAILAFSSHATPYPMLALGAALTGMLIGAEGDLMPFFVKRYFGLASFGVVYGFMISLFCVGTLLGPILYGVAFDRFHSYVAIMSAAGGACLISAFAILLIGPYRYVDRPLQGGRT